MLAANLVHLRNTDRLNEHPVSQQITDGVDVGVGQHVTLVLSLDSCRIGQSPALLSLPQSGLSSIALASSLLAVMSKRQGQFSGFQVLRVGSPAPTLSGPALLCCPEWRCPGRLVRGPEADVNFGYLTPGQSSQPDGRKKELQEATVIGWSETSPDVSNEKEWLAGLVLLCLLLFHLEVQGREMQPLRVLQCQGKRTENAVCVLLSHLDVQQVTRLVRPGVRPRVSGAGERAGRGAVRCGARLCPWARGSPPLPSPARRFPRRSPSLDRSQRPGLPRAHGSRAPGVGQRRRPGRAGSFWPLGAERAQAEQGVTRTEQLRSIGFTESGDLLAGGGGRGPRGRKRRRGGSSRARRWPPTLPQASRALVSDSGWRVALGECLETLGRQRLGGGGLPLGTRRTGISLPLWKRWLPSVLKGLPRLQVDLRLR
ncbi:hypothetical protein NN561_009802 [Cricetulus griseus]